MDGDVSFLIKLRDEYSGKLSGIQKQTQQFDKQMSGLKGTLKSVGGLLAGAFAVGGAIEFLKSSKEAYDKLEASVTRVNTVLASTKGAAGLTSEQIENQAKELSKGIVASRSEILDAQGMLLSFTGIKGPIFAETTKAVADFATFYKTDMTSAALSIGKAMNDPAMGMNRLQRQGVTFTEQQKKQVKIYEQQGNLLAAQRIIIEELNREFGGQAKAFALTDAGKLKMAAKRWSDIKLTLGEMISKIQLSLIPAFNKIMNAFQKMVPYIKDAFQVLSNGISGFISLVEKLWPILKYIIGLFIAWKALKLFDTLITGAESFIKTMGNMKTTITEIGEGLNKWTLTLLSVAASALLIQNLFNQLKNGGSHEYGLKLAEPYRKELDSLQYAENQDSTSLTRQLELREQINTLKGSGVMPITMLMAQVKEQIKVLMKKMLGLVDETNKEATKKLKEGVLSAVGLDNGTLTKIESAAPKVFNINIQKLVDTFTVTANTMKESASNVEQMMVEALLGAVNDVQITANL